MTSDMLLVEKPLQLKGQEPIAHGNRRAIYSVEDHPGILVKVLLSASAQSRVMPAKRLLRQLFPSLAYRFLFREYACYLRAKITQSDDSGPLPISELRGLVQTDLGLGMIVENICDRDGNPGPTLRRLLASGAFDARHLELLNNFVRRIYTLHIRANDLNPSNIVLGHRGGVEQFVLVDGLGDSHLIPVRSWARWMNTRSLNRRFAALTNPGGLVWDADTREFRLPRSREGTAL